MSGMNEGHWRRMPPMAMPTSFADQLRFAEPRLRERLKLPPWLLFPLLEKRPDQANWTPTQQERFVCAVNVLIANGTYGNLVAIHGDMSHMMHGTQRFLPWHRVYLMQFEQALQSVHPDVVVPYWNWTAPTEQGVPAWLAAVTPTVPMPSGPPIAVIRAPGTGADLATIASNIPAVMGHGDFVGFWQNLEAVHGAVHVWVGGSMSQIPTAPADPIFWMHHANIDRIWATWQAAHAGINPDLAAAGLSSVMDPWSVTEPQTRSIAAMGYEYV